MKLETYEVNSNIPPCICKKGPEREFRNSGTRGRPLTQRHLPDTLQEFNDSSCDAKVQNILVGSAGGNFYFTQRLFASLIYFVTQISQIFASPRSLFF